MALSVISTPEQYYALIKRFSDNLTNVKILCDNPELHSFFEEKNIKFDKIDEECIKENWPKANLWVCRKALLWKTSLPKDLSLFDIEIDKALYVSFSYYLTSLLKNYLFSIFIKDKYKPQEIIVFSNIQRPPFPAFNGNYFLNLFLKETASRYGIKLTYLKEQKTSAGHKQALKDMVRSFITNIYVSFAYFRKREKVFLALGGLNHLGPIVKELKKKGKKIIVYDFDFNFKKFIFCLRERLKYFVPGYFKISGNVNRDFITKCKLDFKKAFEILRDNNWFNYEEINLGRVVYEDILNNLEGYLNLIAEDSGIYEKILKLYNIEGLILDENFMARKSFVAAFFKSKEVKSFTVNHGYFALRISLPASERIFDLSTTFVHSEYEKSHYESWGWDGDSIKITGIPRYDRLAEKSKTEKAILGNQKIMKILFCPTTFLYYSPAPLISSYLGRAFYEYEAYTKVYFNDLTRIIEKYPVKFIIKPHYQWDQNPLEKLIAETSARDKIILKKFNDDIFKLMLEADLVILANWSTAIIESVILGVPALVMDYSGLDDGFPLAKEKLCSVVKNFEQLQQYIAQAHSNFLKNIFPLNAITKKDYFIGVNDGGNAARAVDEILYQVEKN